MRAELTAATRLRATIDSLPLIRPCGATFPQGGRLGECKLFHQNLDHGFSYVAAAGGLAAGLVQLTGEEHGKASPTQRHAAVLGAGPQTEVVFLVKLALLRALGRPAQMLAAGQVDLQVGIAAVVLERSAVAAL